MKVWLRKNGISIAVMIVALAVTVLYDLDNWLDNVLKVLAWSIL